MNSLSWLLYLANLFGSLNELAAILILVCVALFIMLLRAHINVMDDGGFTEDSEIKFFSLVKKVFVVFCMSCVITVVTPNSTTVYMIAASEMGETAISQPEFAKLRELLSIKLDEAISDAKPIAEAK